MGLHQLFIVIEVALYILIRNDIDDSLVIHFHGHTDYLLLLFGEKLENTGSLNVMNLKILHSHLDDFPTFSYGLLIWKGLQSQFEIFY